MLGSVLASLLTAGATHAYEPPRDEPALLRVRLTKGDAFRYEITATTSQEMTVQTSDISNEATSSMKMTIVVDDATLDRADVTATLVDVRSKVRVRGLEDAGVDRDTAMRLTQLDGVTFRFTIDQFGRTTNPQVTKDGNALSFLASMRVFERFSSSFPKRAVPVGGSWTSTTVDTSSAPSGDGDIRTTTATLFTYRGIRDTMGIRCWVIDAESASLEQEGEITTNGIDLELEGSGRSSGRMFYDVSNGLLVVSRGSVSMQTQMSLSGQQVMVVPVATHATYSMSRILERR